LNDPLFDEYRAARAKIDAAAAAVFARRASDIACKRGCSSCCVEGLSVLPVEAYAIAAHLEEHGLSARPAPPPGGCAFLDEGGACTIYEARPVLCRTHGLPLRMAKERESQRPLKVLDDVEVCALNFLDRAFAPEDVLEAERLTALLLVVDQRFREAAGLAGEPGRVLLSELLEG
jgi:uncharacterized protein